MSSQESTRYSPSLLPDSQSQRAISATPTAVEDEDISAVESYLLQFGPDNVLVEQVALVDRPRSRETIGDDDTVSYSVLGDVDTAPIGVPDNACGNRGQVTEPLPAAAPTGVRSRRSIRDSIGAISGFEATLILLIRKYFQKITDSRVELAVDAAETHMELENERGAAIYWQNFAGDLMEHMDNHGIPIPPFRGLRGEDDRIPIRN
ncbi:hypothetical protein AAF712_003286 [Marasmius tenuissimus]|uniref:Uncharacterized protein n=1 Tax=Marasmius tenuissimus TaxID=585030 RepID=A0ABR3A7H1_9AGAR|nr:hypothetical protein PM082_024903 [Marasmius tenuissimus]